MNSQDNDIACRAKDPANCRYHGRLAAAEREIGTLLRGSTAPTAAQFERYWVLRNEQVKYRAIIGVAEYDDLEVAADRVDTELAAEMKTLLSKRVARIPVDKLPWQATVKAAVAFTSAQSYGARVEALYRRKRGYIKVRSSEARGDARDPKTNKYFEVKFSVMDAPDYQIDLVQIRPHHNLDAYHILAFDKTTGKTEFYVLSKDEMTQELTLTGQRLAHGVESTRADLVNAEYAVRFKKDSDVYNRWQQYRQPITWS